MNNAFTILGAEPTDSAERLQELLDEKELLLDDVSEVQSAYADLTNPKKRVQHEIAYFCEEALSDFNKLVSRSFTETPTIGKVANILVELGWWFESDNDELFDRINDARSDGGFTQLEDESIVALSVENLKQECISSTNSYFDRLTEKALVNIFNQIVKIEDYESFFIDELLAYYELTISEQLQEKEKKCETAFDEIERLCNQFNNGGILSTSISGEVTEFGAILKDWDNYAQPLQVNMQRRGGQHDSSGALVHDIRNRIISLCNCSQEQLNKSIESFEETSLNARLGIGSRYAAMNARDMLEKKLNDSISFTKALISLIDILSNVFAELEITAEQLKKDRSQLVDLRDTLTNLRNQIPGAQQRANSTSTQATTSTTQWTSNSSTNNEHNGWRIVLGILAAVCGILMIVGFANENIAMGIAFIILGLAFAIGCGAFYSLKENKKALLALVIIPIVLIFTVVIPVASCSSNTGSNAKTYTITLNKDGGTGGTSSIEVAYNSQMPSATKPTKSGYDFMGYYSSYNGSGTKYYDSNMNSSKKWDKENSATLYAYWKLSNNGIELTKSNFEKYFTLTSNCSVTRYDYNSSGTANYTYSIAPKSSFHYNNSNNPSSITVVIGVDISSFSQSYGTPSEHKITVTLYKSSGYKASGSQSFTAGAYERYWLDGIYSVDAIIYN